MNLLVATTNPGKLGEFRQMLGENFTCINLCSLPGIQEIEETGQSFAENAALKAAGYARQTHQWTLADDSGLCVDALNGSPGIYSARWSLRHGGGRGAAANNHLLLGQLQKVPAENRGARFVCALALTNPAGQIILTAEESIEGQILTKPRGAHGFGYDPLFFIPELNRTAAELSPDEKAEVSHRGKAMRTLVEQLRRRKFE